MQPLVSIIIPVYNSEKYLHQCLDSVVKQTYKNIQIICVDDNSTDNSWKILKDYAKRDSRLLIFRKKNEGVSLARNMALEKASGKYLLFVDSDDWIEVDTCRQVIKIAEKNQTDVIMWSYIRETNKDSRKKIIYSNNIEFDRGAVKEKLYRRMVGLYGDETSQPENADALCTVWGKLYRRELIEANRIRFYDIRDIGTYEDGLFNLEVFSKANNAIFINKYLYHYRRSNISSLTTVYNPDMPAQWHNLFQILRSHIDFHDLDMDFMVALKNRIVFSLIALGINEIEKKDGICNIISRIKTLITDKEYRIAITDFEFKYLPMHWKVFFLCSKWRFAMGVYVLLLIIQKIRGK